MCVIIYVCSLIFQIAGALILLINSVSTKRDSVIISFVGKGLLYKDNNSNEIDYNEKAYKSEYKRAYLSRFAFGYIAFGYLMSIWGNFENENKIIIAIVVLFCAYMLIFLTSNIVSYWVDCSKKANKRIENDDLVRLGLKPNIDNISDEKIDEIFR